MRFCRRLSLRFGLRLGCWLRGGFWIRFSGGFWLRLRFWFWCGLVIRVAELGQLIGTQAAAEEGRCSGSGGGHAQLLHQAVEGWLQRFAIAIEQLELEEVFAGFQWFEPKRLGPIENHTAAIEAQP